MTLIFIFADVIKNRFLVCKLYTNWSCDQVDDMINCHNFSRDISGENFNFILCLELEILGKVYTPHSKLLGE